MHVSRPFPRASRPFLQLSRPLVHVSRPFLRVSRPLVHLSRPNSGVGGFFWRAVVLSHMLNLLAKWAGLE